MIRALFLCALLFGFLAALTSCGNEKHPGPNVELLASDIHVSIGKNPLVLPFIALDDYAYRKQSFSLDRKGDSERARNALEQFLNESKEPKNPLVIDGLTVVVRTYGWTGEDMRHKKMCPMLTREWARSVCDNPWAAVQQALPVNRFQLVDLNRLQIGDHLRGSARCRDDEKLHRPIPQRTGEAELVCTAMVFGGRDDEFHHAVIRINGDLGALWTVWRYGQNGETAEAMAAREGKAIVAFVQYALGRNEEFQKLHADMCRLRRPGSVDGSKGAECVHDSVTASNRNRQLQ